MAVSLFTFVDLYNRALDTLAHILTKGAAHAATIDAGESEMLDWRLIDDMQPLRFQVMVVCNFTLSGRPGLRISRVQRTSGPIFRSPNSRLRSRDRKAFSQP